MYHVNSHFTQQSSYNLSSDSYVHHNLIDSDPSVQPRAEQSKPCKQHAFGNHGVAAATNSCVRQLNITTLCSTDHLWMSRVQMRQIIGHIMKSVQTAVIEHLCGDQLMLCSMP